MIQNQSSLESHPVNTQGTGDILSAEAFEQHLSSWSVENAAWLRECKRENWESFQKLPLPTRKDERWRFSSAGELTLEGFRIAPIPGDEAQQQLIRRSEWVKKQAASLVFADDHMLQHTEPPVELQDQGLIWKPLKEAFESHSDLIERYFLSESVALGSEKLAALHAAYCSSGYLLYVPRGLEIEDPFVVYHWANAEQSAIFPHSLIIVEDNARVNVVDFYLSSTDHAPALSCAVNHLHAGPGAQVFRKTAQNFNEQTVSFQIDATIARRDADIQTIGVHLGGKRARAEQKVRLAESGVHAKAYSLTVANKEQEFDQRTLQVHSAPNAVSDLLYKNALLDTARTIFSGMILVDEVAQQTDAYQTNRNLLLSEEAEANSLPGLEIQANDVKCSHGATTGKLDESALFYMLSRGIPKPVAQELLVFGFFEEIIEKVDSEELADCLRELVQNKFHKEAVAPTSNRRVLKRTCPATLVPYGSSFDIPEGTEVEITHRLGDNFTVTCEFGMFRINGENADALGEKIVEKQSEDMSALPDAPPTQEMLWEHLKNVYDPEIPVNIVDLGLVYHLEVKPYKEKQYQVDAAITLTAPGCGMGPVIAEDVRQRLISVPGIADARVDIVWDPPWTQDMISEEGKMELGLI